MGGAKTPEITRFQRELKNGSSALPEDPIALLRIFG